MAKAPQKPPQPAPAERISEPIADLAALPAKGEEFSPDYVHALVPKEVEKYRVLLGK